MRLEQELANFRAEFERTAPSGRAELYSAKVEELRRQFPLKAVIAVGDDAPDFTLPSTRQRQVSLTSVLHAGPAIVTFYRGGWCPYCNIQLRAYQRALPEIAGLGGQILAISPQLPDGSLSVSEKNALEFDVLSDVGNGVGRSFGLVYALPEELREALRLNNKALPGINGDESWELPVPATFVIGQDRRVALAHVDVDYRRRLPPEDIIATLRSLPAPIARRAATSML
ncbi:AhpC/TSA family protein [Bradyrhizobium sp. Pear77]|uniref:peroxiredoxin-like family protein n=1 Tax=Bradyrhizobium altum TaxID=1571202 RepID=UPI002897950B|nr:peroxiredoxin-like family protein [Bradyrhizobium altum]MCC8955375.1 AhpC/TSA family protein [Bradyrhizobium altum]